MPNDEEEVVVLPGPIDTSAYPANTNPSALGWWEDDPGDMAGYFKIPTSDTTIDPDKQYFGTPLRSQVSTEHLDIWTAQINQQGVSNMSETAIAYSTYQTYLMYRTASTGTYTNLIPIKDYPDMIQTPNMLDATSLSDGMEKQIPGIIRLGDGYQFTANYTPTNFSTVKALEGHQYNYALWLGGSTTGTPDGHNGKFEWTGDVRVGFPGKGVDEVQEMTITAIPSTDTTWSAGT